MLVIEAFFYSAVFFNYMSCDGGENDNNGLYWKEIYKSACCVLYLWMGLDCITSLHADLKAEFSHIQGFCLLCSYLFIVQFEI